MFQQQRPEGVISHYRVEQRSYLRFIPYEISLEIRKS